MLISVNKKYEYNDTIEHQGLEALTGIPVQKAIKVLKKVKKNSANIRPRRTIRTITTITIHCCCALKV